MIPDIPFREEFRELLADGRKTATTRSKRYCKAGETFTAFSMSFTAIAVTKTTLRNVAENFFKTEGLSTTEDFVRVWDEIHPRKKYADNPERVIWLHIFKRIG